MKGIIIAGGTGSRLDPLTRVCNKNLLPVYDKPLIYYPINLLKKSNIKDIVIVCGKGHAGQFLELLRSGEDFGVNISYRVQENPGGIAQALNLCGDFINNDKCAVILGDNIFENEVSISKEIIKFSKNKDECFLFLKEVQDPERFGVAEILNEQIISIEEKPENPKSNLAVTGLYLYNDKIWDVVKTLKPSQRGEIEITDLNNFYILNNSAKYHKISGWWIDAGTFDSMLKASILVSGIKTSEI